MLPNTHYVHRSLGGLRPDSPICAGHLTILPFTSTIEVEARYVLLAKAIERGRLTVTEVNEGGAVPFLRAVNQGPRPVLIFDGEELVGAKQNRIVNTTLLLGVGESLLPVSCVEQGRWSHRSESFSSGEWASHPNLRRQKELQVRENLRQADVHLEEVERAGAAAGHTVREARAAMPQDLKARAYRSDQGAVWNEVARGARAHGVRSNTGAMADVYAQRAADLERTLAPFAKAGADGLPRRVPLKGMVAAAVFVDGRFVCLDALWPARRFAELWPKLVRGYALEGLQAARSGRPPRAPEDAEADVLRLFARLADGAIVDRPGVDLGDDLRIEAPAALGAGLAWDGELLQLTVFPR